MIADVAFDAPVAHPFSYRVPDGGTLAPGQRVVAALRGAQRTGMVVALREGADATLKSLLRLAGAGPVLSPAQLELVRWISAESLSSVGSTCAALLPPPLGDAGGVSGGARRPPRAASAPKPELFVCAGRERRAFERIEGATGTVPVVAPAAWPAVALADRRGIVRREPLTPSLARAIRETLAAKRRVFLAISRLTSSLACDDCGTVVGCEECRLALAYSRAGATLACRLCGRTRPLPDTCPSCRGRRPSPVGWGAARVEHAARRRFP